MSAAHNNKVVVKTLCLDSKTRQLDTAANPARDRYSNIEVANDDYQLAGHELSVPDVLGRNARDALSKATCCAEQKTGFSIDSHRNDVGNNCFDTGPDAKDLGNLLDRVALKTTNTETKKALQTVANSLKNNGTYPTNLGNAFPSYASPA